MTQVLIDRATLEHLVEALNIGIAKHWDLATDASIGDALAAGRAAIDGVERVEHKPKCNECAKWSKEQADNREWQEGVAEGRRIVEKLAAKELQCKNS